MSDTRPPARPGLLRRTTRLRATFVAGVLLAAGGALSLQPASAALAQVGPVSTVHGFPEWFSDGKDRLELCLDPAQGCLAEPPGPGAVSHPDNFPDEAFYFHASATGGTLSYEAALEAAYANGAVVAGEEILFGRIRVRMTGLVADASYTVTHPYGVNTFTATAAARSINVTIDRGCLAAPCGTFSAARDAFLGDYRTETASWLRQVGAAPGTLGGGALGAAGPVTGAPSGNNFVRVEGPNAGGQGIDVLQVDDFSVQGRISTVSDRAPSTPDLDAASDSGGSRTDNITNATTVTFTGRSVAGDSVDLVVDGTVAATVTADLNGTYRATVALTPGTHRVLARIADPNVTTGPPLESGTLSVTVDTTAPAAAIGPSVGVDRPSNPTADDTPTFRFSAEPLATFACSLSTGAASYSPCVSPLTYDRQLAGAYTFRVRATDRAGNTGPAASYQFQLGSTPPPATAPGRPAIGTARSGAAGGAVTATATWTAPAGAVTGYVVRAQRFASAASTAPLQSVTATQPATASRLVMTLPRTGTWRFSVRAVNDAGQSAYSARSNAVTGR